MELTVKRKYKSALGKMVAPLGSPFVLAPRPFWLSHRSLACLASGFSGLALKESCQHQGWTKSSTVSSNLARNGSTLCALVWFCSKIIVIVIVQLGKLGQLGCPPLVCAVLSWRPLPAASRPAALLYNRVPCATKDNRSSSSSPVARKPASPLPGSGFMILIMINHANQWVVGWLFVFCSHASHLNRVGATERPTERSVPEAAQQTTPAATLMFALSASKSKTSLLSAFGGFGRRPNKQSGEMAESLR